MKTKLIKGLSQVQSKYDAFFIDLWGVIHNGIELYQDAMDVLENLNKINKRYVLISNAPRPSKSVEKYLIDLNQFIQMIAFHLPKRFWKQILKPYVRLAFPTINHTISQTSPRLFLKRQVHMIIFLK